MRIAIEGCAHGELDIIYNTITEVEKLDGKKIDLLICCGDFQATRNISDLECMAVPNKYKDMCTFYKYYSGEKIAPVLTIFVGGNHEASNYLQELSYGGWVAPNIYYLGYAGVVNVAGVRIAGISGIYNAHHFIKGHYEIPPYSAQTIRSAYYVRNLEIFRLKQLSGKIDIFLSHDWPVGVTKYGDEMALLRRKSFFKEDIDSNRLGSPPNMELIKCHYPTYWFSAHLHCKFTAVIPEEDGTRVTKFLALDKCLPRRKFLQVLDVPSLMESPIELSYDLEWLTILYLTNHLLSTKQSMNFMPGELGNDRWQYTPTTKEIEIVEEKFNSNLKIPFNFTQTVKPYDPNASNTQSVKVEPLVNDQTTEFCERLGIDDPAFLLSLNRTQSNPNEKSYTSPYAECSDTSTSCNDDSFLNSTFEECLTPKSGDSESDSTKLNAQTEPECKKFKRRNYSMYSDTT